ncbi:MAG: hypothetical protein ACLQSR_01355 [Limisphaerales bacterium]
MKSFFYKIGLLCVVLFAGAFQASALDGAVVIANPGVSADSLSADALKDIYTGKTKYWDNGQAVVIVVLSDKTDAALQQASGMGAGDFKTYWQRLMFSGRGQMPKTADDEASLVSIVASTKGAIALAPTDVAKTGIKTIDVK